MFNSKKFDRSVQPWEVMPADAGTYKAGQILRINNGKVGGLIGALTTVPPYVCMADKKITTAGDLLPVMRVTEDTIFEAPLSALTAGAKPGAKLQVAADGLGVNGTAAGAFEVTQLMAGTAMGDLVRGRFTVDAPGA